MEVCKQGWAKEKSEFDSQAVFLPGYPPGSLQGNHLVWHIAGKRRIQIGEAADGHALDRPNGPVAALAIGLGQPALIRALITEHQQHTLFASDDAQALAQRIALTQRVGIVIKKEHPHNFYTMAMFL